MYLILFLVIVFGFALCRMTAEDRERVIRAVLAAIPRVKSAAIYGRLECEPFRNALCERTPWPVVTPALIALNVVIFIFMLFGTGALGDPATLIGWGGNFGPRTTGGEWWRLLTSVFVHPGMLQLLVDLIGLVQIGLILERLVGPFAFASVYVAAGVFASLVNLSAYPLTVSIGASGAVFGLYGLLLASSIWGLLHRSILTIPLMAVKRLIPAAAVFIFYNVSNDGLGIDAELAGLATGFVCGLFLARGVSDGQPSARHVAAAIAAAAVVAIALAVPLRGITDVRPEICTGRRARRSHGQRLPDRRRSIHEGPDHRRGRGPADRSNDRARATGSRCTPEGGQRSAARTAAAGRERRGVLAVAVRELAPSSRKPAQDRGARASRGLGHGPGIERERSPSSRGTAQGRQDLPRKNRRDRAGLAGSLAQDQASGPEMKDCRGGRPSHRSVRIVSGDEPNRDAR